MSKIKYLILAIMLTGCDTSKTYYVGHLDGEICVVVNNFDYYRENQALHCEPYTKEAATDAYKEVDRLNKLREGKSDE